MPLQRDDTTGSRHTERPLLPVPLPTGLDHHLVGSLGRVVGRTLDGVVPGRAPATFARSEREALCVTALRLGPGSPTLCGDWDAQDLVAHLLVRERDPLGAAGMFLSPLSPLTRRAMHRNSARPFGDNLERLRSLRVSPFAIPVLERVLNTLEFFVHHEDMRRSGDGGPPRDLPPRARQDLWLALRALGGTLVRDAGMPVALRRTDAPSGETATSVLRPRPSRARASVRVVGDTGELVLFCYGRGEVADVRLEGDEVSTRRLRNAGLGI